MADRNALLGYHESTRGLTEFSLGATLEALHRNLEAGPHSRAAYEIWTPLAEQGSLRQSEREKYQKLQARYNRPNGRK